MNIFFVFPTIVAATASKLQVEKKIQCAMIFAVENESAERVKICNVKALTLRHNTVEEAEAPI